MSNFYQHFVCLNMGARTLDHCYKPYKQDYKAVSCFWKIWPQCHFLFSISQYKQWIYRDEVVIREVKWWSAQSEAKLQDALNYVNWDMICSCSDGINKFTEVAVSFISMLAEKIITIVRVKMFTNHKPWVNRLIHLAVNVRTTTYNVGLATDHMSIIWHPECGHQMPVVGASGVSLSSGWHTEHVALDCRPSQTTRPLQRWRDNKLN